MYNSTKIFSSRLIIFSGVKEIATAIFRIFNYSQAIQSTVDINIQQEHDLVKTLIIGGLGAFAETSFGLILLTKPSKHVRYIHIAIGILLFLLPLFLSDSFLEQVEDTFIYQASNVKGLVHAQSADPDPSQIALNDYQFQLQKYRDAHKQYLSAKNAFLSFNTLTSRTTAIDKTKTLVTSRSLLTQTYLRALRTQLASTPTITQNTRNNLSSQLQNHETFLQNHAQNTSSITDLNAIISHSNIFQDRYPQIQTLAFTTLYTIQRAQQNDLSQRLTTQQLSLSSLATQIGDSPEINTTQVAQWLKDTDSTLAENQLNLQESQDLLEKIKPTKTFLLTNTRTFQKIQSELNTTKNRLFTVTGFLNARHPCHTAALLAVTLSLD